MAQDVVEAKAGVWWYTWKGVHAQCTLANLVGFADDDVDGCYGKCELSWR